MVSHRRVRVALDDLFDAPQEPFHEINVTPFVDVMLVLLVIFMVTVPLLEQGVDLTLPEATAATLEASDEVALITINLEGTITLDGEAVAHDDLRQALIVRSEGRGGTPVVRIRADTELDYGRVVAVLALVQGAGINEIDLVSVPSDQR